MRNFLSFFLILSLCFQGILVYADSPDEVKLLTHIQGYNVIAKQYNEASGDKKVGKKRILTNLRNYVNRVLSKANRHELKKKGYILRISPINGNIPLISTGGLSLVNPNINKTITSQVMKNGNLIIKELSFREISEVNDYKVYQSEITATGGDVTLERIDFIRYGNGNGISLGKILKSDTGNSILQLKNSKDTRTFKYNKKSNDPVISFDIYGGNLEITNDTFSVYNPGMKIKEGDTVSFIIKLDIKTLSNFTHGEDFQRTNYIFAKYKILGKSDLINGNTRRVTYDNRVIENGVVVDQVADPDKGITINNGRRVQNGFYIDRPTEDIYERPLNEQGNRLLSDEEMEAGVTGEDNPELVSNKISTYNEEKLRVPIRKEEVFTTCSIKGNVNFFTGEKIYHLPGSNYYNDVIINSLYGEHWFCSELDAVNAGWRKEQGY